MKDIKSKLYKTLRWSEKYTKTDMVYLASGGFWLTISQIITAIASFGLAIAFANLIPKEVFGTYKYVLSIAGILMVASLRGMGPVVTQAVAKSYEGSFLEALKTRITWGLIATIGSLAVSGYYYINDNYTLAISFLIISIFLPFVETLGLYNSFLEGRRLFKASSWFAIVGGLVSTSVLILVMLVTDMLFIILLSYFISWTLIRYIFLRITLNKFTPNKKIDPEVIPYGKHASFVNITATLIGSLEGILIFHFLGAAAVAIYSFALAPILQIKSVTSSIGTLAVPKLAKKSSEEVGLKIWSRFFLLSGIGVLLSALYIIIAPFVFKIFFPQYMDAVLLSQIFSLSLILALGQTIIGAATTSQFTSIPKKLLYLWNIPTIVLVVTILILIKDFGIMGAIIGKLLSLLSGTIIGIYIWLKIKNKKQENKNSFV